MLRDGPIPAFVHGIVEYGMAALLIAAPFLLAFDSGAATAVAVVAGVALVLVGATSDLPTGLVKQIPVAAHAVIDFAFGAFLVAAPFIFGFADEGAPTAFFIVAGVFELLLTVGTRFTHEHARAVAPADAAAGVPHDRVGPDRR